MTTNVELLKIYAALLSLGYIVAMSARAALTADVPPAWLKVPARWRPLAGSVAGVVATVLGALAAHQPWGTAVAAGIAVLTASVPSLIAAEKAMLPASVAPVLDAVAQAAPAVLGQVAAAVAQAPAPAAASAPPAPAAPAAPPAPPLPLPVPAPAPPAPPAGAAS